MAEHVPSSTKAGALRLSIRAAALAAEEGALPASQSPFSPSTKKRGSRRDREFRRYAEAVADLQASIEGEVATSSRDLSLTALAQLVALRLNVKRAMISLFDRERHYVIAEATRTLSLQEDDVHAASDALCFGASVWERSPNDFFRETLRAHKTTALDGTVKEPVFEVNDLLNDVRYANHQFVVSEPFARSFAGVPLLTPTGYAIGTVSLFDDQPRESSLTAVEIAFMQDIASTAMAHIEKTRLVVAHSRSIRMIHGLSRFIEGKATADEQLNCSFSNAEHMRDRQNVQTSMLGASHRTHAMNAASNAERIDDYRRTQPHLGLSDPSAASGSCMEEADDGHARDSRPGGSPDLVPQPKNVSLESDMPQKLRVVPNSIETVSAKTETLPNLPPADLQEDLLSKDVRHSFERAASIINSAMGLSGTLFLDASVGEFGRLRGDHDINDTSAESDRSRSEADAVRTESEVRSSVRDRKAKAQEAASKPCRSLASAYAMPPTTSGKSEVIHLPIPERYLKSLLRRFPYGKQWNFDPYGNTSSDELSDSSATTDITNKDNADEVLAAPHRRTRNRRRTDGQILSELFPGARSLALMPIYDAVRERFFAGAIVWSYDPIRVLTAQDDLNYLCAFCDVIMAEVGRLDAQAEAQTKTSFISSMSHELRTPLHGILGGIECLQDKNNAVVKEDMLQMIEASGRSLLDIIDHLLEHAHATGSGERRVGVKPSKTSNKIIRNREGDVQSTAKYNTDNSHPCDLAQLTEEVLNTTLWSTPKPSLPTPEEAKTTIFANGTMAECVKVILEVDPSAAGEFRVNSGAWRRIVQNLANNSIKYCDEGGYFKVSLSAFPYSDAPNAASSNTTMVELVCLDSGRGMSQQYLKFGLWQAFSQENSSSQGTGLGLSLVHGIVKEMGGTIDVQSSKGVGSAIRVRIPLRKRPKASNTSVNGASSVTLEQLKSCTCAILGFEEDVSGNERSVKADGILKKSIITTLGNYGVRIVQEADIRAIVASEKKLSQVADVIILAEKKAMQLSQFGPQNALEKNVFTTPTIVLCHSIASSRVLSDLGSTIIAVSQPLGPRKLLRALTSCLEKIHPDGSTTTIDENPAKSERNLQSPLVITSRPETIPRSSYFGVASQKSNVRVQSSPSGLMTLLVDDNDINLTLLRAYMNKHKHSFTCASNGMEAVDAYQKSYETPGTPVPSIILMDLTMPVMSGLEATRQIRAFERTNFIKPTSMIIALTAMNSSEARQEAFGSGVDLFLTKPVKLSALGKIIEKHMEERHLV